jgi:hypothetical protein
MSDVTKPDAQVRAFAFFSRFPSEEADSDIFIPSFAASEASKV